jgi:ABC-type multidrug transport system ATPase subunit
LWYGIKEEGKNSAIIITTHAMEEAEALAKKIAIMASGRFKCFGTLHQIQMDYGGGFEMEFNLESNYFADLESRMPIEEEHLRTSDVSVIKNYLKSWQMTVEDS